MSRKLVKNDPRALDDVPLFRDTAAKVDAVLDEVDQTEVDPAEVEASDDGATAEHSGIGETEQFDTRDIDEVMQALADPEPAAESALAPRRRRPVAIETPPGALHPLWIGLGMATLTGGIALAVATAATPANTSAFLAALARIGLTPTLLLVLGCCTWGIGALLGRQNRQAASLWRVEGAIQEVLAGVDQVESTAKALHAADASRAATAMSGDEFGQVLYALQRNDEKVSNLTRATKTFGKPLVEMTSQLAEAAAQLAQTQAMLQALRVASENGLARLEDALRKQEETLQQQSRAHATSEAEELRQDLDALRTGLQNKLDLAVRELRAGPDAVQQHVEALGANLESALAASMQRLGDSLNGVGKDLGTKLAGLGGKQAPVDLAPVQNAIADLRRELAGLLNSAATRPSTAPAAAPAAAAPAPAAPTPSPEPMPASGLAQSIAGEHAAKASNVLGAIAKLKKMRS